MSNDPSASRSGHTSPLRSIVIMVVIAALALAAYMLLGGRDRSTSVRPGSGTAQAMSAASDRPQPAQPAPPAP